ncbi:MAG TPA: response regulator [Gemmatimonadales bacterium]|nr:response regulator [Gemmatimonadales bacterium]
MLVVDDEPQVRALSARVLVDAGFDVLEAGDAVEALAHLQAPGGGSEIRLVITDIVMPGMQGPRRGSLPHRAGAVLASEAISPVRVSAKGTGAL